MENKTKDFTGMVLTNILFFIAGVFLAYGLIGLAKGRILNSLEYANYKTLDYKQEVIKAYHDNFMETFNILHNVEMNEEQWSAYHKSTKKLRKVLDKEGAVD